jgi:hypothetical protein
MTKEPKILDPGLPHGRLWVVEKGCECPECSERRVLEERRALAEARAAEPQLPARQRDTQQRWSQPRWTKLRGRWVVTQPLDAQFWPGKRVMVRNHTKGTTIEVTLSEQAGMKYVEGTLELPVWWPTKVNKSDRMRVYPGQDRQAGF